MGSLSTKLAALQHFTSGVKSLSSAGYTILDLDGFSTIAVSTGASNQTVTLPATASNIGRILTFKKTDSGAGQIIVTRAGSDTIDGATSYTQYTQYSTLILQCTASGVWSVIEHPVEEGTNTATFVWNGTSPGAAVSFTMAFKRHKNLVTMNCDASQIAWPTTGNANTSNALTAAGMLPAWATPSSSSTAPVEFKIGGSAQNQVGVWGPFADGSVRIYQNPTQSVIVAATQANTGLSQVASSYKSMTYVVN